MCFGSDTRVAYLKEATLSCVCRRVSWLCFSLLLICLSLLCLSRCSCLGGILVSVAFFSYQNSFLVFCHLLRWGGHHDGQRRVDRQRVGLDSLLDSYWIVIAMLIGVVYSAERGWGGWV